MKAISHLPAGYRQIDSIDLQKDKKAALTVNALALLIGAAIILGANLFVPITSLFTGSDSLTVGEYLLDGAAVALRFLVLGVSIFAYLFLHELVHGIVMKALGTKKVRYGFTGLYAFAGSDDYYDKSGYLTVALAPILTFGVLFAAILPLVPQGWFWVVYLLQVINLSGAAGDLFVTVRFARLPKDIAVRDCGVSMTVYSKSEC